MTSEDDVKNGRAAVGRRVVSVGLGAIGAATAEAIARRRGLELVGAVDPVRAGERIGGVEVVDSIEALDGAELDVAVVATSSSVPAVLEGARPLVERGIDVVTSCEELSYPWFRHAEVARPIDELARSSDATVVGTGVNPGLIMDVLPVLVASASLEPRKIVVKRSVDLSTRRPQLREKMGAGLEQKQWDERAEGGGIGHAGLLESAILCAVGVGWEEPRAQFERQPILAEGVVSGVRERAQVEASGGEVDLELVFELQGTDLDQVEIHDDSVVRLSLEGINGDTATVARLVHAAESVALAAPGLRLPTELPGSGA